VNTAAKPFTNASIEIFDIRNPTNPMYAFHPGDIEVGQSKLSVRLQEGNFRVELYSREVQFIETLKLSFDEKREMQQTITVQRKRDAKILFTSQK
jgi:hypothetical protein